jgi:hypothetical protein
MGVPAEQQAVGDPLSPHCARLDIHVGEQDERKGCSNHWKFFRSC